MNTVIKNPESISNDQIEMSDELSWSNHVLDFHLEEFSQEVAALSKALDVASSQIIKVEQSLATLNIFVEFEHLFITQSSKIRPPAERHYAMYSDAVGWNTENRWYLAWKTHGKAEKWRLFLVCEELEVVDYHTPPYHDSISTATFKKEYTYSTPLSEAKLSIRLQYLGSLSPFIEAFKQHLKRCRVAIERNDAIIPF